MADFANDVQTLDGDPTAPVSFRTERENRAFRRWVDAHRESLKAQETARRASEREAIEWNIYMLEVEAASKPTLGDRIADAIREWWHGAE